MFFVGIEKIPDNVLREISEEVTAEIENRNRKKIHLSDDIARAIYRAQNEGFNVSINTADGLFNVPDDSSEFIVVVT